jgi:hypothetical protein
MLVAATLRQEGRLLSGDRLHLSSALDVPGFLIESSQTGRDGDGAKGLPTGRTYPRSLLGDHDEAPLPQLRG